MTFDQPTFRQLTAPGYFDYSAQQTAKTAAVIDWFDRVTARIADQVNLFDETFRLWATRDYTGLVPNQGMYLYYLSQQIGFTWIQSNLNTERDLLAYLVAPRPGSFAECINQLYNLLFQIGWVSGIGSVIAGKGNPINFSETLIIFSNAGSPPATPANTPYARRAWDAPPGWTKAPSSSTYVCRGYLYNNEIIWLGAVSTASPPAYYDALHVAGLPTGGGINDGDVGGVFDDGSGDTSSIYTYFGGIWFKCSTEDNLQGSIFVNTYLDSSGVFAPDVSPPVTSQTPPPVTGPSQGYGFYGLYGVDPTAENIELIITLTAAGFANLGTVIQLFRKIKPFVGNVILYAMYGMTVYIITIKDSEAIN